MAYMIGVMFIVLIIVDIFVKISISQSKKIKLNNKAYHALLHMLDQGSINLEIEKPNIIESKRHLYDPLKNVIAIRDFKKKTIFDHIALLHEGGHYLSINKNKQRRKWFVNITIIIAINRLLVIPLLIITPIIYELGESNLFVHSIALTATLIFFVIASYLRMTIGISEEYRASKLAYAHIQEHYEEMVVPYARHFYIGAFLNHLLLTLIIISSVLMIYYMVMVPK